MINIGYRGSTSDYLLSNGLIESVHSLCSHTKSDIHFYVSILEGPNEKILNFFKKINMTFGGSREIRYDLFKPDLSKLPDFVSDFIGTKVHMYWASDRGLTNEYFTKLFLSGISLPHIVDESKLLVIGADTLFLDDVSEPYATNLDGKFCGAVHDIGVMKPLYDEHANSLNITRQEYFNADFILYNCDEYRKHEIMRSIITKLKDNPQKYKYYDQDILNELFKDNIVLINQRWNIIPCHNKHVNKRPGMIHFGSVATPYVFNHQGLKFHLKKNKFISIIGSKIKGDMMPYYFGLFNKYETKLKKEGWYEQS